MPKWKIVVDSGCDYRQLNHLAPDTEFISVPLTIQIGEQAFVDDANLDIDRMMEVMESSSLQQVRPVQAHKLIRQLSRVRKILSL